MKPNEFTVACPGYNPSEINRSSKVHPSAVELVYFCVVPQDSVHGRIAEERHSRPNP